MATETGLPAGRTALVTGASSGIGESIATTLVNNDYRVICASRRGDKLAALSSSLGSGAHALELDVTDASSVESLLSRLPEDWRSIDILVNNAGHDEGGRRRFDEGSAAQWASIIETNVIGLIRTTHAVIPGMIERDVVISSTSVPSPVFRPTPPVPFTPAASTPCTVSANHCVWTSRAPASGSRRSFQAWCAPTSPSTAGAIRRAPTTSTTISVSAWRRRTSPAACCSRSSNPPTWLSRSWWLCQARSVRRIRSLQGIGRESNE